MNEIKKDREKAVVRKTEEYSNAINNVSQAQDYRAPEKGYDSETKISSKKSAEATRLQPIRRIKTKPKPDSKCDEEKKHAWEYVTGVFENKVLIGEGISFWLKLYPGDDYCEWHVPANVPVSLPRHVANHLAKNLKYCTFKFKEKAPTQWRPDDFADVFAPDQVLRRGTFTSAEDF